MSLRTSAHPSGPFSVRGTTYLSTYYLGRPVAIYRKALHRR